MGQIKTHHKAYTFLDAIRCIVLSDVWETKIIFTTKDKFLVVKNRVEISIYGTENIVKILCITIKLLVVENENDAKDVKF